MVKLEREREKVLKVISDDVCFLPNFSPFPSNFHQKAFHLLVFFCITTTRTTYLTKDLAFGCGIKLQGKWIFSIVCLLMTLLKVK